MNLNLEKRAAASFGQYLYKAFVSLIYFDGKTKSNQKGSPFFLRNRVKQIYRKLSTGEVNSTFLTQRIFKVIFGLKKKKIL